MYEYVVKLFIICRKLYGIHHTSPFHNSYEERSFLWVTFIARYISKLLSEIKASMAIWKGTAIVALTGYSPVMLLLQTLLKIMVERAREEK